MIMVIKNILIILYHTGLWDFLFTRFLAKIHYFLSSILFSLDLLLLYATYLPVTYSDVCVVNLLRVDISKMRLICSLT